jgi:hypothetical protein
VLVRYATGAVDVKRLYQWCPWGMEWACPYHVEEQSLGLLASTIAG